MSEPTTTQEAEGYLDVQITALCRCGQLSRRLVDHTQRCWYKTRSGLWRGYAIADVIADAVDP